MTDGAEIPRRPYEPSQLRHNGRAYRRSFRKNPYMQGEFDGLCGVYAVLNAVRLLCPEVKQCHNHNLVFDLSEVLTARRVTAQEMLALGLEIDTVRGLVRAAKSYLEDVLEIEIKAHTPRLQRKRRQFDELWHRLAEKIEADHVAIIGLSGRYSHWTVIHRVTLKTLFLFDSDRLKTIRKSQCALKSNKVPHRLSPEDVILIRRMGER